MTAVRRRISKQEILRGAATILDNGVFGDLTVDALARTLHMSKSTLYKHFASKEELVVVLVDEACTTTERAVAAENPADASTPADEALAKLVEIYAEHSARLPRAVLLQTKRLPPQCQERVDQTNKVIQQAVEAVIGRGADGETFSQTNPHLAALGFMAAAQAAMVAAAGSEVEMDRSEAVHAMYELFRQGLHA